MTRSRSLLAALLIAGIVLALAPSLSSAQYRGGFYGGGARWGGGVGTGYYGGGYGGYYGNGWGGYPGYYAYDRGSYPSYGYSSYSNYNPGFSLNWNSYPTYSGYYSNYGYPSYSYSNAGMNSYYPSYSGYYGNSGFYGAQGMQYGSSDYAGGMNYQYGSLSEDMRNRAFLNVRLPSSDAEVWIEGDKTRSTGMLREYMSPTLDPDKRYSYEIKARWMENGKEVTRTKKVSVRVNAPTLVDFTTADRGDTDRPGTDKDRTPGTDKDRSPGTDKDRPGTNPDRPDTEPKSGAPDK
jgi:uncharacterized protein (TIGR03000 family)